MGLSDAVVPASGSRAGTRRIGLTGGIGSGKSTVAGFWQARGAVLVDTDAISRELTAAGGAAMPRLREVFGESIVDADGSLHRPRMRELAFTQPQLRRQLEAVLHPLIGLETQRRAAAAGEALVVFDVPLLVESGRWRGQVERVLVVDCPREVQLERVMRRSGLARETVERIIDQQADRATRRASADAVIDNGAASLGELEAAVACLWRLWHATDHA